MNRFLIFILSLVLFSSCGLFRNPVGYAEKQKTKIVDKSKDTNKETNKQREKNTNNTTIEGVDSIGTVTHINIQQPSTVQESFGIGIFILFSLLGLFVLFRWVIPAIRSSLQKQKNEE